MKAMKPLVFAFLAIVVISQAGCKKKDETPAPDTSIVYADSASGTGYLSVQLRRWTGTPGANIGNAFVALYLTYEDYANDISLTTGRTDGNGYVDFGYLNVGNYYIYSEVEVTPGNFSQRVDVVQVQSRTPITKLVYHEF
ncbi:MAG: hypothetical protein KF690_04685 [Bacteroidetes bacterium]|nr:hypothetical protein [Bacteroidota bacterium]